MVTGNSLKALLQQYEIAPESAYDQFSLTLTLDGNVMRFKEDVGTITYGSKLDQNLMEHVSITNGYELKPGQAVLACSSEVVHMPMGYIGFLQTKGSLARLFITIQCCDAQVESGYHGKVTFEICNMGTATIRLLPGVPVGQLYIFETTCKDIAYNGKYNHATQPTISNKRYNIINDEE